MKKSKPHLLALSVIFSFCTIVSFAQSSIKGTVKDEKGQPVIGASVSIKETGQGTLSDQQGGFYINIKSLSKVTVLVSNVGFEQFSRIVNLQAGENQIDITLKPATSSLSEVVVTATNSKRTLQQAPLSVTQYNSKQLTRLQANSQADILRTISGIRAEGGGGEVASNVFVRGLPAGGQYKYTPIQIDGVAVESTFGLTSSAQDVWFRQDLGFEKLEFVRGGSSTLFGVGSVAGIINYTSRKGGLVQKTIIQTEVADLGRYKFDFNTGGPISTSADLYYNVSGTYRYDNGPIRTGLPTQGYQVRANISKKLEKGEITLYFQAIDDRAQFYLPIPLSGTTRKRVKGNDGEDVFSVQTNEASRISYLTPDGVYKTPIADGASTKGTMFMVDFTKTFGSDWNFDAMIKTSRYDHQFNLFLDGAGAGPNLPETQDQYALRRWREFVGSSSASLPTGAQVRYTFTNSGLAVPSNFLLFENRILDRNRPMFDMSGNFKLTKKFQSGNVIHNVTLGSFVSRTEAQDFNVTTRYLAEFNNQPRLVDLTIVDGSNTVVFTKNGVSKNGLGYANRFLGSNKIAGFIGDEMIIGSKWRVDGGLRVEKNVGSIEQEGTQNFTMNPTGALSERTVQWGNGKFNQRTIRATSWAAAIAASYEIQRNLNVYANTSRGYFFPELRSNISFTRDINGNFVQPDPGVEKIWQTEGGVKYGSQKVNITGAIFYIELNDRLQNDLINVGGNAVNVTRAIGKTTSVGAEINTSYRPIKFVSVDAAVTVQKHRVVNWVDKNPDGSIAFNYKGNWLVRQPRFMFDAGAGYDNNKYDIRLTANHVGKVFADNRNQIQLDPVTIFRFDMGYTMQMENRSSVRLSLGIFNLFNTQGITEGSPRQDGAQVLGGTFFVGRPELPRRVFARATLNF